MTKQLIGVVILPYSTKIKKNKKRFAFSFTLIKCLMPCSLLLQRSWQALPLLHHLFLSATPLSKANAWESNQLEAGLKNVNALCNMFVQFL